MILASPAAATPLASIRRAASRAPRNTPRTLTAKQASHASGDTCGVVRARSARFGRGRLPSRGECAGRPGRCDPCCLDRGRATTQRRQLRDHSSNRIAGRRGGWGGRASSSRRTGCSPRVAHESRRRDWCSAWSDCSSRCGNNSLETRSVAKPARATVDACEEDRSRDAGRRKRPERRNGDSRPAEAHLARHSLALAGGVAAGRSSNRVRPAPAPASRLGLARARAYHCHKCRATT